MSSKLQDAIMIAIIMITIMNYADYIKVDTKLMMVLLAIALYVTAKQTQKSNQNNKKVEPLDGSTVAFDKEAFVNLNKIVNELVKSDSVTIPGNLIVKGTTTFEDNVTLNDGKGMLFMNKAYAKFGEGATNRLDGNDGWIGYGTHGDGLNIVGIGKTRNIRTWGHLTSVDTSQLNFGLIKCVDLSANNNITAGTDDGNMVRIRQQRIGTKNGGDIEFSTDGWKRFYTFGTGTHNRGVVATEFYCTGTIHNVGNISGGTIATNAITATTINTTSTITCPNVTCSGTVYTRYADIDTLSGHAWATDMVNVIRVTDKFTIRNDGEAFISFGGWFHGDDTFKRPDMFISAGKYASGGRGAIYTYGLEGWDHGNNRGALSRVSDKSKPINT